VSVPRTLCAALCATALAAPALPAQGSDALYARVNGLSGFELRAFSFDSGLSVKRASQWHVPFVFVAPLGRRLSVDVSTSYVGSSLETSSGTEETISGLTDTQVRFLYTVRKDRLATSLSFNLPTGQRSVSTSQFAVSGAVGSNFLAFPVAALGTAFGVTGGVAMAARAGTWNVGLAGSVRVLGSYEPFSDAAATYSPGLETRVRAGVDRLLGSRTRLLVGLTGSTFSTDEYSGGAGLVDASSYKPGTRVIADLGVVHVAGRTVITLTAWDYYRLAGRQADTTATATKENVLNMELRGAFPVSRSFQLQPLLGFRQYSPADYRGGRLYSGGVTAYVGLSERLSAQIGLRLDRGWVNARERGFADLTGYGATVLVRYQR
jgi:hypothetical protein